MSYRSSTHHNKHGNANRNKIMEKHQFQAPIMDTAPYSKSQEHYPIHFYDPSLAYVKQDSQAIAPRTAPGRLRVIEYEYEVPQPPPYRNENYYEQPPADEDIDEEAEDFIKLEHRKFLMSKTMSNKE